MLELFLADFNEKWSAPAPAEIKACEMLRSPFPYYNSAEEEEF